MSRTPTKKRPRSDFFQLVPKQPLEKFIPVVSAAHQSVFSETLHNITDASPEKANINKTPRGQHICADKNNVCGQTPGGTKLIYSPSKHLRVEVITPNKINRETIDLCLLERETTYATKNTNHIFGVFPNQTHIHKPQSVIADPQSKAQQPPRNTQKREKAVVGKSAKEIVIDFFKKIGVTIAQTEIEKENWNLCHLLSYGIAMNGKTNDDTRFDTQIPENLFAGTRVLNENMMRIENPLLKMIKDNDVKEIEYMAVHSEFEDSHILASLTLKVGIMTHDGREIHFDYPFDVTDERKLPHESSTAYYTFLQSIIHHSPKNDTVVKKLPF